LGCFAERSGPEASCNDDRSNLAPDAAVQLVGQFPAQGEQVRFDAADTDAGSA
jgi:hypothetical protein